MLEMKKRREGSKELETRLNKQSVKDFRKCCQTCKEQVEEPFDVYLQKS